MPFASSRLAAAGLTIGLAAATSSVPAAGQQPAAAPMHGAPAQTPSAGAVMSAWQRKARADHGANSMGASLRSAFDCEPTGPGTASCLTDVVVTVSGNNTVSQIPYYGVMHYKLVDGTWLYDEDHSLPTD